MGAKILPKYLKITSTIYNDILPDSCLYNKSSVLIRNAVKTHLLIRKRLKLSTEEYEVFFKEISKDDNKLMAFVRESLITI